MSDTYKFSIVSSEGELYRQDITFLKCKGEAGELGIYPNHTTLISTVKEGDVYIDLDEEGRSEALYNSKGILYVMPNEVKLLVDFIIWPEDCDLGQCEEDLEKASQDYTKAESYEEKQAFLSLKHKLEAKVNICKYSVD
mgnify:CR=1 FL=1